MLDSAPRLAALRDQLAHHDLAAYVVDSGDSHANEYLAHADERRAWISGFTGSAGTALVLQQQALLWTDGRYHQQAAQQLSPDWTLMKHGAPSVPSWTEWLSDPAHSSSALPRGSRIGLDPALVTVADYTSLAPALAAAGVELVPIRENLVDIAWDADERAQSGGAHGKPQRPREEVFVLDEKHAGESAQSKIERVRRELDKRDVFGDDPKAKPGTGDKRCWGLVVTLLDEIAWLLNLRGSDIPFNPVFFAYLVLPTVSSSRPTLFIDLEQVPQKTYDYLTALDILIEPYEHYVDFLEGVGKVLGDEDLVLLPSRTSLSSALALSLSRCVTSQRGPIALLKALKNPTEVQGFRDCHVRDGVALVRYFAWLERELKQGKELREYEAALQLEEFRKQLEHFRGLSFSTISSTGANASVIHYSPAHDGQSAVIDPTKIYLCDSGAQFTDGTTDVTRTLHFGNPTSFERRAYTRVLQGHLAIDRAVFPSTTTGYMLDPFARAALWQDGLDYRHGTGHGVGHFLNVHEGPMGIGTRVAYNDVKLQPYQILSNEPGYYHEAPADQGGRDASFGIRIENLVCVVPAQTEHAFGGVKYYRMERLTMCPIATNLVDPALLELRELEWLNKYNAECLAKVGPLLRETGDADAVEWLERSCRPLSVV
ncbi:aminopeptidase P [Rhodotorula paludigena]|uniref:aminopeptidase P n=1 Tax=Rhodotorula paludigena TaxID=86838 RepID=UPI0031725245